jgi:hypothetical protein
MLELIALDLAHDLRRRRAIVATKHDQAGLPRITCDDVVEVAPAAALVPDRPVADDGKTGICSPDNDLQTVAAEVGVALVKCFSSERKM